MKYSCIAICFSFLVLCTCATVTKRADVYPEFKIGRIIMPPDGKQPSDATIQSLMNLLKTLVLMVDNKNWDDLPRYVSKQRGLFVDLKGHRSYAQLLNDIKEENGYLHVFYYDTAFLRKSTNDQGQIAIRDVLRSAGTITVDFYMEEDSIECELKLYSRLNPKDNFRLNQPIFVLENQKWLVYRLF